MSEGIIFGGHLLDQEQFITIFKEWYEQKGQLFYQELQELSKELTSMYTRKLRESASQAGKMKWSIERTSAYDAAKIFSKWEEIQKNYFGNGAVTLIAITRFDNKELSWTKNIEESEFMTAGGINVTAGQFTKVVHQLQDNVDTIMAAERVQQFLRSHYQQMTNQLSNYLLNKNEAHLLHQALGNSSLNKQGEAFTNRSYGNIIFHSQGKGAEGKQLDAFMNHVGQYNKELLYIMSKKSATKNTLNSVGFDTHNQFMDIFKNPAIVQPWLISSLNTTSWFTGGDVVVIDSSGMVIYNIQIKSTSEGKNFELSLMRLNQLINRLIKQMNKTKSKPETLAKMMYNSLKTSSVNEIAKTENFLESATYEMVKERLGIK